MSLPLGQEAGVNDIGGDYGTALAAATFNGILETTVCCYYGVEELISMWPVGGMGLS